MKNSSIRNVLTVILVLAVGAIVALIVKHTSSSTPKNIPDVSVQPSAESISITKQDIKETNFTGNTIVIKGASIVATEAQKYVDATVADFKKEADSDVPDIRVKFGNDVASANYEIDIAGTYVKSATTESVVVSVYTYTGGAHGSSSYKVFSANIGGTSLLSLGSVIQPESQNVFMAYLKKSLMDWRPDDSDGVAVFPEQVDALTFDSLSNWSLDKDNLIIYFDQYDVGPGALGAVAFPLPLSKVESFINSQYK